MSDDIEPVAITIDHSDGRVLPKWLSSSYSATEQATSNAIRWYIGKKKSKSRWSRSLRSLSILFGVVGLVVPLVAPLTGISLAWGYTALGLAGGCVALDKLFGFSSSWVRYIQTEFELQYLLQRLRLEWNQGIHAGPLDAKSEKVYEDGLVSILLTHTDASFRLVRAETAEWAAEFTSALDAKLEDSILARTQPKSPSRDSATGSKPLSGVENQE